MSIEKISTKRLTIQKGFKLNKMNLRLPVSIKINTVNLIRWYPDKCHSILFHKTPISRHGHKVTPGMRRVSVSGKSTVFYRAVWNYDVKQTFIITRYKCVAELAWKHRVNLEKEKFITRRYFSWTFGNILIQDFADLNDRRLGYIELPEGVLILSGCIPTL